jgi:hypothetical protein
VAEAVLPPVLPVLADLPVAEAEAAAGVVVAVDELIK